IRDFHVTGVQTCALPISPSPASKPSQNTTPPSGSESDSSQPFEGSPSQSAKPGRHAKPHEAPSQVATALAGAVHGVHELPHEPRSEERRVGREGRWRWPP